MSSICPGVFSDEDKINMVVDEMDTRFDHNIQPRDEFMASGVTEMFYNNFLVSDFDIKNLFTQGDLHHRLKSSKTCLKFFF
jgi:hypothetical protein